MKIWAELDKMRGDLAVSSFLFYYLYQGVNAFVLWGKKER